MKKIHTELDFQFREVGDWIDVRIQGRRICAEITDIAFEGDTITYTLAEFPSDLFWWDAADYTFSPPP